MIAACCQFDIAWENKPANHNRVRSLLRSAALPPQSLVLLPEMFDTGFSMNVAETEDGANGKTRQFLSGLAGELSLYLIGGLVSENHNEAVTFDPDGHEIAHYQKIHLFTSAGEPDHLSAGKDLVLFDWCGLRVCPLVCYDLRFPETFRAAVKHGANCFTVIANWPAKRESHWLTLLQARAIENQAYVAGVNRIGDDPQAHYNGRSLIIDPRGEILADAGAAEKVVTAEMSVTAVAEYRQKFPVLGDIRSGDGF